MHNHCCITFYVSQNSHALFPIANTVCFEFPKLNPINHYSLKNRGFRNSFDYVQSLYV